MAVDGHGPRLRHGQTPGAHLLGAMTGHCRTVTWLWVADKTNEITCFAALSPYGLTGVTVTADALHAQRSHARFLVEERKAHYLLVVKTNQPEPSPQAALATGRTSPHAAATVGSAMVGAGRPGRPEPSMSPTSPWTSPTPLRAVRIRRHRTHIVTGTGSRQIM